MTTLQHAAIVTGYSPQKPKAASLAGVRWRAVRPMLLAAILITLAYLSLAMLVIAVDPYNVYRWGSVPRIKAGDNSRDLVIDWIDVVAKDPEFNTFLVGSSVTAMYTPKYLERILGSGSHVANLSYGGPRPRDRDLVLDQLAQSPSLKRIILTFDWNYFRDPEVTNVGFPTFLYDNDISNDLRMVNLPTIRKTFDILGGQSTYSNPGDAAYDKFVDNMYARFQRPEEMARIGRMITRNRAVIGADSGRTCHSLRAINEQLVPDVRDLSARGVKVDILFPIVSFAFYYVRRNDISHTLLDDQMIARRCLVEAVGNLPNVRIFALDDEPAIAGDLANFREVGHIYNRAILNRFISLLATGKDRLTPANFARYEGAIRSAVRNYRLTNSRVSANPRPPITTAAVNDRALPPLTTRN